VTTPQSGHHSGAKVSVVVLAYLDEPWLEKCVYALLDSEHVDVDVILVDNGCTDGGVERLRGVPGVLIVGDGQNLGFSGGCNLGVAAATGEYVALVNGDLIVHPDALVNLVDAVNDPGVAIAMGSVRLSENSDLLNSAGNEIHFLGFSWVGHFGERADTQSNGGDVAGAMGAFLALRRATWEDLGGFDERYFAFHEDAELSWRCWQTGRRVRYVPEAVGIHRYEFNRVGRKLYLAERNRLIFVLTMWQRRTLLLLAPAFVAVEVAVALAALKGGWFRDKVDGWNWVMRNRRWLVDRRQHLQSERTVGDRKLSSLMATHLDAANFPLPSWLHPLDDLLAGYWALARRFLS
jgi:GT2 family glycosyltransferase